jgi:hypothetical protein
MVSGRAAHAQAASALAAHAPAALAHVPAASALAAHAPPVLGRDDSRATTDHPLSAPAVLDPVASDPMVLDPVASDPMVLDPVGTDRARMPHGRAGLPHGRAGLPHGMRRVRGSRPNGSQQMRALRGRRVSRIPNPTLEPATRGPVVSDPDQMARGPVVSDPDQTARGRAATARGPVVSDRALPLDLAHPSVHVPIVP